MSEAFSRHNVGVKILPNQKITPHEVFSSSSSLEKEDTTAWSCSCWFHEFRPSLPLSTRLVRRQQPRHSKNTLPTAAQIKGSPRLAAGSRPCKHCVYFRKCVSLRLQPPLCSVAQEKEKKKKHPFFPPFFLLAHHPSHDGAPAPDCIKDGVIGLRYGRGSGCSE